MPGEISRRQGLDELGEPGLARLGQRAIEVGPIRLPAGHRRRVANDVNKHGIPPLRWAQGIAGDFSAGGHYGPFRPRRQKRRDALAANKRGVRPNRPAAEVALKVEPEGSGHGDLTLPEVDIVFPIEAAIPWEFGLRRRPCGCLPTRESLSAGVTRIFVPCFSHNSPVNPRPAASRPRKGKPTARPGRKAKGRVSTIR